MKRFNTILSILVCFLFSFNVKAQVGQASRAVVDNTAIPATDDDSSCDIYDVGIEITDVEWNVKGGLGDEGYHAVHIEFIRPADFNTVNTRRSFTCDITVNLFKIDDKPVKFIYETHPVSPRNDAIYNEQGELEGFRIFPIDHGGTGVASEANVMGRVNNVNNSGSKPCVQMIVTNRAGENCSFPNEMNVHCDDAISKPRIAQTVEQDIKAYPSPAQDNLFVEINDLDIKEVNMMSLYGQTVSDKVAIRYDIDKMQINTTQLESGIYLIVLETASGRITKKVMIQKD